MQLAAAGVFVLPMVLVPEALPETGEVSSVAPVVDFGDVRREHVGISRGVPLPQRRDEGRAEPSGDVGHGVPSTASAALTRYNELKRAAEWLNERHLQAQDALASVKQKLRRANADLTHANASLSRARADERKYRTVVDEFAAATYTGGHLTPMTLVLSSGSKREVLERAATIRVLAEEQHDALSRLAAAVEQAKQATQLALDARERVREARDAAARHQADIAARKLALDAQVAQSRQVYARLSAKERAAQQADYGEHVAPPDSIVAPSSAAQRAIDAAMSQRGKPYSYGSEGPYSYDCSGLMLWAYAQAGIAIPRSSSMQASSGTPVSRSQLQPGDLVFFYQPVSHVGIYIGDGKMVHSPTEGDVVKISEVMWDDYTAARRYS